MKFTQVEWHDCLASTNSFLLDRVGEGDVFETGYVVAVRDQTAGRGRYERKWVTPAGKALTFSFLLATSAPPKKMVSLPLATALWVAEALEQYGIQAQTKWPNDVVVKKRKICGILAERANTSSSGTSFVVVGIGINVNTDAAELASIDRPATSMLVETGGEHRIEDVLDQVLASLSIWLNKWEEGGFPALEETWGERCIGIGQRVRVGENEEIEEGTLNGFGPLGQLLLRRDDGVTSEIWAGDVSW